MSHKPTVTNFQSQLDKMEPLVPLVLAAHGVTMLLYLGAAWWQWLAVGAVGGGGILGLRGWPGPGHLIWVRLGFMTIVTWLLMLTTEGTSSFFLLWYFVLIPIYALLLTPPQGLYMSIIVSGAYASFSVLGIGQLPLIVVLVRVFLMIFIGWLVQTLGLITRRQMAEYQKAEVKLLYQASLLQNVSDAIIASDLAFRVQSWNRGAEAIYGWHADEVMGKAMNEIVPTTFPDDRRDEVIDRLFGQGFWKGEVIQQCKDDRQINVLAAVSLIRDSEGKAIGIVAVNRDITERKQLEEQLIQSQKLEAIGRLAGGIAHDFNNLLTVIMGHTALLLDKPVSDFSSQRRDIEQIKKSVERASALIRQLLAFSRRQVLQPKILNLNTVVTDMAPLLHRFIGPDILLTMKLQPNLGEIKADHSQIEQVIMNLAVNARDAMPQGGNLTIETINIHLDNRYTDHRLAIRPGPYIRLTVIDTGSGMSREIQERIFEPFFTTKEQGKGTGLGLATIHGIVNQSGGHIQVYSKPGLGTSFKIYLPQVSVPVT